MVRNWVTLVQKKKSMPHYSTLYYVLYFSLQVLFYGLKGRELKTCNTVIRNFTIKYVLKNERGLLIMNFFIKNIDEMLLIWLPFCGGNWGLDSNYRRG